MDRLGFYPVVHVSRIKMVDEFGDRPSARLTQDVNEATRLDFDEKLLPEDSWEPYHVAGEFEVEAILDDRTPLPTSTERAVREFKRKWVGGSVMMTRRGILHQISRAMVYYTTISERNVVTEGCK
ncbi:hypothetical protein PHMEG_00023942 [Phytophthora megakarya]|uniref:Reverse transcriptase n=1 Tax=Phytophthora megakarya TaxID=4795 RepID=A0A225VFM4_9STRA|nr:hypothetical protein PHMEG_00023942 [Phytophthora megakarya]